MPGGTRTTHAYRYDNLRASQNPGSGVQTSVWDVRGGTGYGDLFEELDSSNNRLRAYYRAPSLAVQKDGTGSYAFHWMDQGTAQLLSDATQANAASYQFTASGELLSLVGGASSPLSWNGDWGYYRDATARTWVRARHLDVLRGRWFSRDPIGLAGVLSPYSYVNDNPNLWVDPLGLWATGSYIGDVGAVFRGYRDAAGVIGLGLMVGFIFGPWAVLGLAALALAATLIPKVQRCGWAYALKAEGLGLWHDTTDWTTTDDPYRFGFTFGNFLGTVSPAIKRIPSPQRYIATKWMQNLTNAASNELAANPRLAAEYLSQAQYENVGGYASRAHLVYGTAVEKMVARRIQASLWRSFFFDYRGGAYRPDFVGRGYFRGLNFDITTPEQVAAHQARPYGPGLIIPTYNRPTDFGRFPQLQQ